jgi:isorenieratene synthase
MDRRDFIRAGGLVAAGAVASAGAGCAPGPVGTPPADPLDFLWPPDARRRIVLHRPRNPDMPAVLDPAGSRSALVVGGGIAGLSAGLELAERGYRVTLREASEVFGGRLATRDLDPGLGRSFRVEHGLHMWFDNYRTFTDILHRLGTRGLFRPYEVVNFQFRRYRPEALQSTPKVFPLNLAGIVDRSPNLGWEDIAGSMGILPDVMGFRFRGLHDRLDHLTFFEWMDRVKVNPRFRDVIFQPAAHVTLNKEDEISAAEMLLLMHVYFTSQPYAFDRTIPTVDHGTAVVDPWVARLRALGATVSSGAPVDGLRVEGDRVVGPVGEAAAFDWVVLAADVPGANAVLGGSTADAAGAAALSTLVARVGHMEVAPPYRILRVWFDRQLDPSRPDVIETPQHAPVALVCQYHQLEDEPRQWSLATGGSVIEFHLYSLEEPFASAADDEVWDLIAPVVHEIVPELAGAGVLGSTIGSYDNFSSFASGLAAQRPFPDTPMREGLSNLVLAGDWVAAPVPSALMERSVLTGRLAANECLVLDGVREVGYSHVSPLGPAT